MIKEVTQEDPEVGEGRKQLEYAFDIPAGALNRSYRIECIATFTPHVEDGPSVEVFSEGPIERSMTIRIYIL